jgi:hypothetical protein
VSRNRDGSIVPGGVIQKRSHGHMNVYSPRSALDWRVSVATEDPGAHDVISPREALSTSGNAGWAAKCGLEGERPCLLQARAVSGGPYRRHAKSKLETA